MDVPPPSLLSIIYTLNAPVSHACLVGEVRVGMVDHDSLNASSLMLGFGVSMEAIIPAGFSP